MLDGVGGHGCWALVLNMLQWNCANEEMRVDVAIEVALDDWRRRSKSSEARRCGGGLYEVRCMRMCQSMVDEG